MRKNNIPFKVAVGYSTVAIVLVLAISLVYSNTKSILAINQASREYIDKRDAADSAMSALLKEEQLNLKQLTDAMAGKPQRNYLRDKMQSLNDGKDSVVVKTKTPQTHEAKSTTVEVVKTRKGFFRRLADAFKKEHAETLSVKRDSNRAIIDSIATPVNVAENVADILQQIERREKHATRNHDENVNKELEDLRVVSAKLALRSAKQLNDVHQRERASMQQAIKKAMEARQHLLWQIALLAIIAIVASVILIAYIWRDTRRERIYRENLEQANEEIKRIMNQRERLLLTITHDIKAPAASISGFIDLMKAYVTHPRGIECLANIKHAAQHLSQLVATLLDYHQLENGLIKPQPSLFSPVQLVKESIEGMRPQAEGKGLQISWEFSVRKAKEKAEMGSEKAEIGIQQDAGSERLIFSADAFRIRQILNNLVSNAIKYTDRGSVHIQALIMPTIDHHTYELTLSVKDTGKGMTTEEKQKVFQAFTRLKNAQGVEGTGLGLSITQELVSLLGGEIHLFSAVGKGSTFTVCIPIKLADKKEEERVDKEVFESRGLSRADGEKSEKGKKKLLILDDDKLQLQLLQEMLRRMAGYGWRVFTCSHVTEALTVLHNEQPSLMLMDVEMPEMNGMEMIKHINHSNMKVVAMTAHDTSIKPQLLEAGFDDCLFKPFSMEKLKGILGWKENESSKANSKDCSNSENKVSMSGNEASDSEYNTSETSNNPFAPLLAFAEGDEEAAQEIIKTVKQEIAGYCSALCEEPQAEEIGKEPQAEEIGKIAHKLLPIAAMLQLECLEELQLLAPEHIHQLAPQTVKKYVRKVVEELKVLL